MTQANFRKTPIRDAMLQLFAQGNLYSVPEIPLALNKKGLLPNKTTIYREIEFLKDNNLIQEIDFGDGKKRYERTDGDHHHHLICISCKNIDDVTLESDLDHFEQKIKSTKKFKVTRHSLEFFGLCHNCQK